MIKKDPENVENPESFYRLLQGSSIWREYFNLGFNKEKYSALGKSTLQIPSFHKKNVELSVKKMETEDYQYQNSNKTELMNQIIQYFPPIQHFSKNKIEITQENLNVTPGALPGISMLVKILTSQSEEVIMIQPLYPHHMAGFYSRPDLVLRTCKIVEDKTNNFLKIDFESLRKVVNKKSRVLIITNPCNPTAYGWDRKDYEELEKIMKDFPNLIVLEDASYFLYHSQNRPYIPFGSISKEMFQRSVTVFSVGKMFNTTGIRLGIVVSKPQVIKSLVDLQCLQLLLPSSQDMYTLMNNLKDAAEQNFYENERKKIQQIHNYVTQQLTKIGVPFLDWHGTYYLLINVEKYRNKIGPEWHKRMDTNQVEENHLDKAVARLFYKSYSVGLIPLSNQYITDSQDNLVRLSFNRCQKDIDFMLDAFRHFAKMIDQENLNAE